MIDDLPVTADQIHVAPVSQVHPVKKLLQAVVSDIDEQDPLVRGRPLGDLHCPGKGMTQRYWFSLASKIVCTWGVEK